MPSQLKRLDENFEALKQTGITDARFYIGEISETTAEQFAEEANLVIGAYLSGKVKEVRWDDSSIN